MQRNSGIMLKCCCRNGNDARKFADMNYSENKKVKDLINKGKQVNRLVDSDQLLWHVLLEGKTKRELVYQRLLREINFQNKNCMQAVQGNKEYFWALSEAIGYYRL